MSIKFHSSVLCVNDIKVSKSFYCDILHQEIDSDFGNNISLKNGLSLWQVPDGHILHQDFYGKSNTNKALELYFETENISEVIQVIHEKDIKVYHELIEESWGQKTIRIYDPDQNLIEIGEKLEVFIRRMYQEGLSLEEIGIKTGVPLKLIQEYIN